MKALNLKTYPDEIAMVVGVEAATLFYSILLWCEYNEKHEKNFKHGHYWTYQTAEAMNKKFPYWSIFKIERLILKLKEAEVILVEQLSPDKRVRTRWFAINYEMVESISRNHEIHLAKSQNGNCETAKCNIQVYNNTSNKEESNIIVQAQEKNCLESITTGESMHENKLLGPTHEVAAPPLELPFASEQFKEAWKEWQDYRKERKLKKLLAKSQEMQFAKMKKFPERQIIAMIENAIQAGYQTFIFANSVPDKRYEDASFDPMNPQVKTTQGPPPSNGFKMTEEMRKQAQQGW